jgi:microcystin-dependent protein
MGEFYIGEIRAFSFGFVPRYWAECNGQLLPIPQNEALFSLLGTRYGGDGTSTLGQSAQRRVGASGGAETHTLTVNEIPAHTHVPRAGGAATTADPSGAAWATTKKAGYAAVPDAVMAPGAVGASGGSQPHDNMPPHLVVTYAISLTGIYPSRS